MTPEQMETSAWLNRAFYKDKKVRALRSLLERDRARAQGLTVNLWGCGQGPLRRLGKRRRGCHADLRRNIGGIRQSTV